MDWREATPDGVDENLPDNNPTFQYRFWDGNLLQHEKFYNQVQIDMCDDLSGKKDIMSYEILFRYGGFFVDADSECILPLTEDLFQHSNMACYENEKIRPNLIANGFLGAVPGSELMKTLIEEISKITSFNEPIWKIVGPGLLTRTVSEGGYDIEVFPSHYFLPEHFSGVRARDASPVYCRHHWSTTKEWLYGKDTFV